MRAIELRQLRYFWLLAKELHFGRAAELAFVTQPALSQQIAKLEALMGVQLLIRDRRHVTLTPAGISLRDDAQALFEQLDQALRRARGATTDQEFKISIGLVVVLLSKRDFLLFMMRRRIIGYSGAIDLIYT